MDIQKAERQYKYSRRLLLRMSLVPIGIGMICLALMASGVVSTAQSLLVAKSSLVLMLLLLVAMAGVLVIRRIELALLRSMHKRSINAL